MCIVDPMSAFRLRTPVKMEKFSLDLMTLRQLVFSAVFMGPSRSLTRDSTLRASRVICHFGNASMGQIYIPRIKGKGDDE